MQIYIHTHMREREREKEEEEEEEEEETTLNELIPFNGLKLPTCDGSRFCRTCDVYLPRYLQALVDNFLCFGCHTSGIRSEPKRRRES